MAKLSQIKLGSTTYDIGAAWGNISGKPSTFPPSSHNHDDVYAKLASMNNMVHSSNEWTVVPSEYSGALWLNYRTCGGINGNITEYNFGNGKGGTAGVKLVADTFTGKAATAGYADSAGTCTSLSTNAGSATKAIYFTGGKPAQCSNTLNHSISGNAATATLWALTGTANTTTGHSDWDGAVGNTNKYTVYDQEWACSSIGNDTGDLRVFLRPGEYTSGGTEVCFAIDGDYYVMGNKVLHAGNYNSYAPTKTGGGASGTWGINVTGNAGTATTSSNSNWLNTNSTLQYGASGLNYFNISGTAGSAANANQTPTADWYHIIRMNHANSNGYYTDIASCFHNNNMYMKRVASGSSSGWLHIWVEGNSVTSAVWNDYAECRESDCEEFGYVLMEVGDDSLTKTTERLSHFAGVSSDTWGFSQGETDKAKTPIAVAGRVLVYPYQDRNNYKPGDCVCAAPGGTVDIMTREEVINWPDRIVGTVSSVPDYEEWGGGNDREAVKVNGRIWIKVR